MAQKAETLVPNLEIEMNLGLTVTYPDVYSRDDRTQKFLSNLNWDQSLLKF